MLGGADLARELVLMTDRYTDELFAGGGLNAHMLVYSYSRLVCDPERFRDDESETMAARGMGAVYTKTTHGLPLRRLLAQAEREACLRDCYDPHHACLTELAREAMEAHGQCLIVDAHSFPSRPLPCDQDQKPERPDICIGTDPYHTPPELAARAVVAFEAEGFSVSVDLPYAGTLVPLAFYGCDRRVMSLMVEVNRKLYMEEDTGEKLAGFETDLTRLQRGLSETVDCA